MNTIANLTGAYEITFERRNGYCYAHITSNGKSTDLVDEYIRMILNECVAHSCARILIEKDVPNTVWVLDSLSILGQSGVLDGADLRVALVDRSGTQFNGKGFAVKTGVQPSVKVHVFKDVKEGENWLAA